MERPKIDSDSPAAKRQRAPPSATPLELQSSVLPEGLFPHFGPAGKPPDDLVFATPGRYEPPAHSFKPLQALFAGDPNLSFFEEPHVYTYKGVPASASVTEVVHAAEPEFRTEEAVQAMRSSGKQAWPRVEFVVDAKPVDDDDAFDVARGLLITANGLTLASVPPASFAAGTTLESALEVLRMNAVDDGGEDERVLTYERVLTTDEIGAKWSLKGAEAAARGTEAHHQAELFFNGLPYRWWHPDMVPVHWFVQEHMQNMEARFTELEIFYPEADLAGSVDLVAWDRDRQVYHIIDHKRTDKLHTDLRGYRKLLSPFNHLDKCRAAVYALQLSLYQYIIEKVYGMPCGDRVLLTLHPDVEPFATSVPYLKDEVEFMMRERIAEVNARRKAAADDPTLVCSLSGAPLHNAVALESGALATEKAAKLRGLPFTPDEEARRRFCDAVAARREEVPAPAKWPKGSWRRRFPQNGLAPFCCF